MFKHSIAEILENRKARRKVTSTKTSPKLQNNGKRIKKLDFWSWAFVAFGTVLIGSIIFIGIMLAQKNTTPVPDGNQYYDNYLNFSFVAPAEWKMVSPDAQSVSKIVNEATGGILFDMRYHSLTQEVVPVALIVNNTDKTRKIGYSKFMTIAFRGSDNKYSYLQDKVKIMDDAKKQLTSLGLTDVSVTEVIDMQKAEDKELFGILMKATAVDKGSKINYLQYYEPAGRNMLIVTYGSLDTQEKGLKDIKKVVKSITYQDGGIFAPPSIQDQMKKDQPPVPSATATPQASPTATPQASPTSSGKMDTNMTGMDMSGTNMDMSHSPVPSATPSSTGDVKVQVDQTQTSQKSKDGLVIKDDKGNAINK